MEFQDFMTVNLIFEDLKGVLGDGFLPCLVLSRLVFYLLVSEGRLVEVAGRFRPAGTTSR